ncbi:LOW QUALITY PROTEIN: hypothetical protein ACHAW6_006197 [Cyclotella cf. meneghiniana]
MLLTLYHWANLDWPTQPMMHSIFTCLSYALVLRWPLACDKFCILSCIIVGSQDWASSILIACAHFHNHIICEDKQFRDKFEGVPNDIADLDYVSTNLIAPLGMAYLSVVSNDKFSII